MRGAAPVIVITPDTHRPVPKVVDGAAAVGAAAGSYRYELTTNYARAVAAAGGVPVIAPHEPEMIGEFLRLADGVILSGGDDVDMTAFGGVTHPAARVMEPQRQRFELAMLAALDEVERPVLGVCLGMQLMALHAGGGLHQHLPDVAELTAEQAAVHKRGDHGFEPCERDQPHLSGGSVRSQHHQAVADAGRLRVVGYSDAASGELIEAVDRGGGGGRFYLGVQWHPERTEGPLGAGLIGRLVEAAREHRRGRGDK